MNDIKKQRPKYVQVKRAVNHFIDLRKQGQPKYKIMHVLFYWYHEVLTYKEIKLAIRMYIAKFGMNNPGEKRAHINDVSELFP